jgi:hypothetical protein
MSKPTVIPFKPNRSFEINGYRVQRTPVYPNQSLRLELWKPGAIKPYVIAISDSLYGDSRITGLACSCPAWVFKRGAVRDCKHIHMIGGFLGFKEAA